MEFGRHLPVPGALVSSLLLSIFLFWLTGQINYPIIGQGVDVQSSSGSQHLSSAGSQPVISSIIEAANLILSASKQNQTVLKSEERAEEVNPSEEFQTSNPGRSDSNCEVSSRYPESILKWCGLITQSAQKHGIDPNLLAALIWQESGGNPQAYSHSGAVGLMQVMPHDGLAAAFKCPNGPCFGNRPSTNQLKDPDFNVSYGSKMLSGLISRRGSLREALKSYGPAGVGYSYADKVIAIYQRYGE